MCLLKFDIIWSRPNNEWWSNATCNKQLSKDSWQIYPMLMYLQTTCFSLTDNANMTGHVWIKYDYLLLGTCWKLEKLSTDQSFCHWQTAATWKRQGCLIFSQANVVTPEQVAKFCFGDVCRDETEFMPTLTSIQQLGTGAYWLTMLKWPGNIILQGI